MNQDFDKENAKPEMPAVSRRQLIKGAAGVATTGVLLGAVSKAHACSKCVDAVKEDPPAKPYVTLGSKLHKEVPISMATEGALPPVIPPPPNPMEFLTRFDYGKVTRLANGKVRREYVMVASNVEMEIASGVMFPAWTYNGAIPGPTLRCTAGDIVTIHFYNYTPRDHTIHFHGIHPAEMDGAFEIVPPGGYYKYEFEAEPFGLFPYHCHMVPLRMHIARGMYGAFIVDPPGGRPPAREMVMVMHGFDTELTLEKNAFYAVNGPAFYYRDNPIVIKQNELIRVYLVNITEIDFINSMHLHANMFKLFRTGTRLDTYEITDTVMLCQGERCVLEFSYKFPGDFLFHAHQNEFAERGWLGIFRVTE